jgi:hypothetical protein
MMYLQMRLVQHGNLAASALSLTMHWRSINLYIYTHSSDSTVMTRQREGRWQTTIIMPRGTTDLYLRFQDQNSTWDTYQDGDYHLHVAP